MIELIQNFHFLRPWWLLAVLPAAALWWSDFRHHDSRQLWQQWVEPVLLDALLRREGRRKKLQPIHMLGCLWLVAVLALAGPAWQRVPSPFAEDRAALVIVLKVTPSMKETDIAPTRLQRAGQKIADLLAARPGTRNALIAYAGSAHLVMPLTIDANVINTFAGELSPELMPREGDDAAASLKLAGQQLAKRGQPGAILFITDGLEDAAIAAFNVHRQKGGAPVHVWAAMADASAMLAQAAKAGGGSFAAFTPDQADVQSLARDIQQTAMSHTDGQADGLEDKWRDAGYWLLPLLAAMGAFWFRRGWVIGY